MLCRRIDRDHLFSFHFQIDLFLYTQGHVLSFVSFCCGVLFFFTYGDFSTSRLIRVTKHMKNGEYNTDEKRVKMNIDKKNNISSNLFPKNAFEMNHECILLIKIFDAILMECECYRTKITIHN